MSYPHIISKLRRTPWAATVQTLESVRDVLNASMAGQLDSIDDPEAHPLVHHSASAAAFLGEHSAADRPYAVAEGVALIPVFGVIGKHLSSMETMCGGVDVDDVVGQVEQAVSDPQVDQVLLWFNSPGGTVTGVPEAAAKLRLLGMMKQIHAYTDGMMASAAYWLASQCQTITSSPSSDVGSIGVYLAWLDQADAAEAAGYKLELIKAGDFKAMGHPMIHISEDERAILQASVDEIYGRFKAAVWVVRGDVPDSAMQGQTFSYDEQLENNLVDSQVDSVVEVIAALVS